VSPVGAVRPAGRRAVRGRPEPGRAGLRGPRRRTRRRRRGRDATPGDDAGNEKPAGSLQRVTWWARGELNPHVRRHTDLNRARLPFRHLPGWNFAAWRLPAKVSTYLPVLANPDTILLLVRTCSVPY